MADYLTGSFRKQLAKASIGDRLTLHEGPWDSCFAHPEGLVVRRGNSFLLNGDPLFKMEWDFCISHPQGVVIERNGNFFLNGTPFPGYGGPPATGFASFHVVRRKEALWLVAGNSAVELYEGKWDRWDVHPYGALFSWGERIVLVVTRKKLENAA